jgi:co-chaperonin GroES (HSP10)
MTKPAAQTTPTGPAPVSIIPARLRSDLDSDTEMVILPDPVGHYMLIALPTMAEQTKGGIIIPTAVNERERAASVVGTVLAMGPMCYKDPKRFGIFDPGTEKWTLMPPWCKENDKVMFSRYQGQRFKSLDKVSGEMVEYRMLADDAITGTVPDGAEVGGL